MEKLVRGILSGAFATLPMTFAMLRMKRKEPREWLKALPPRRITLRLAHRLGLGKMLDRKEKRNLVWASHFGYGAAMGGLYACFPRKMAGPLYGLLVWAASYLGLMPAMALHRSAVQGPGSRNRLMVVSHLVWGLFTDIAFRFLGRMTGSRWA